MRRLRDIDIKQSIADAISDIMRDGVRWTTPYTVYCEQDFESIARGKPPARPFVFVMAARREIEPRFLPIILVDTTIKRIPFEIGHVSRQADIQLHILARSEGEGESIKDVILETLETAPVPLYCYPRNGEGPENELYCDPEWETATVPIPDAYLSEGTLRYWTVTSGSLVIP